jgi:hypothetical protein
LYSSIATMYDLYFNYTIFEKLMPGSTQDRKKAKIKTGFKECYWNYKTRWNEIYSKRVLKDLAARRENSEPELEEKSDDDLYNTPSAFIDEDIE